MTMRQDSKRIFVRCLLINSGCRFHLFLRGLQVCFAECKASPILVVRVCLWFSQSNKHIIIFTLWVATTVCGVI